jgi:ubiquinone/menaquinone biosynthesis C-methylase UbiE
MALAESERLSRLVCGAALSRAVCSIAELGVADHIESGAPQPVERLAKATGTHERSLYRILRFLASYEVFRETGNREFDHTPLSAALRSDAPNSFRPAAQMFHRISAGWDGFHQSILTGKPGFDHIFGKPFFDYIGDHPELAAVFDAGMTAFHGHETGAMLDAYDFSGINVLADIGGGNGSLMIEVLRRYPMLNGIVFDLGHVMGRTSARLQANGMADRCRIVAGSFFESVPAGADAYLLRHVIHDWTDEQSIQILKNCRKVVPVHGRVLIVEFSVPPANVPSLAKDADMTMLTFPGGLERTEEEYRALFQHAGFRLSRVIPTASAVSAIEGRPA